MRIEDFKNKDIYTVNGYGYITKYSPKELIFLNGEFSNGFGSVWDEKDYGKTWSFDELELYKVIHNKCATKAFAFDKIKNLCENNFDISEIGLLSKAMVEGFYGTMYGMPKEKDEVIKIGWEHLGLGKDEKGAFIVYHWGYPYDTSVYYAKDYRKTWAFTENELK